MTNQPVVESRDAADPPPRVLVVEDEADIAALVAYQLTRDGLRVETVSRGTSALSSIDREMPDIVVLDRLLPGESGDEVLRTIRRRPATRHLPVLMLTAKREQEDRIEGLEMGADDYLTKPFSPRELILRVRSILRRARSTHTSGAGQILRAGPLAIDLTGHQVTLKGRELNLTPTEFRLLRVLVERRGRTQSRRQLLESAWQVGPGVSGYIHTRTVDMHIRRLRTKLEEVGDWVETVRGFGYQFRLPDAEG
ncbi:MAG: response regulator transcription factor [Gammaproteobacteria bacterium]|nr:response regulator transcription factor [Gammaproteobacteria bacterium]